MHPFSNWFLNTLKTQWHLVFCLICLLCVSNPGVVQTHAITSDSLINQGHVYVQQGEPDKAFKTFFDALAQFDKEDETKDYFDVLTALTFHLFYTDTYGERYPLETRLQYIDEAISMAIELEEDSIYTNKIYHKGVLYNINDKHTHM